MISDGQRREIAANLRSESEAWRDCFPFSTLKDEDGEAIMFDLSRFVLFDEIPTVSELYARLANLIYRPTCRNVSGCGDVFECSVCKCRVELITEFGNDYGELFHVPRKPSFCPKCGAEVIE